jgi:hypothetical protein
MHHGRMTKSTSRSRLLSTCITVAVTTIRRATIKWAAHRYLELFQDQPNFKPSALKEMIRRDYNVDFTLLSCHRAKRMAMAILAGNDTEQYQHMREYCNAIMKWNPGSSAFIWRDGSFFQ